jgi:CMP-N-acetylneuraminic acid synthetase
MKSRLCTICARGGSKGVKNKNTRLLDYKPLIAHSILQAKTAKLFEFVAVSSDSPQILDVAKEWGADYLIQRSDEMASDTAAKLPAIQHCARETERLSGRVFDTFVDLDATSPLRNVADIKGAIHLLESQKISNVITGTPARRSPYFNLVEKDAQGIAHLSGVKSWKAASVASDISVREAIETINQSNLQAVFVVDQQKRLVGIVSDRDVRQAILKQVSLEDSVQQIMNSQPTVISEKEGEDRVIDMLQETHFRFIPVVDANGHITQIKTLNASIVRRQDAPPCYDMNASVYVWNRQTLFNTSSIFTPDTHLFVMPEERSVDIDSELDFKWVEFLKQENRPLAESIR